MNRTRALPGFLAALLLPGCRAPSHAEAHRRSEAAVIVRQLAGLRELIAKAQAGETHANEVAIGIKAGVVGEFIEAGLPIEKEVRRFRVRAEKAEAIFRSSQSRIILRGKVSAIDNPDLFADVLLAGALDRLDIDPATGTLTTRIVLQDFEVHRVTEGADNAFVRSALEALGEDDLKSLQAVLPPLVIPVRIDQSISLAGFGEGPVSVAPGRLPVRASVTSVVPIRDRLWVTVQLAAGPWERLPGATPQPHPGPRS